MEAKRGKLPLDRIIKDRAIHQDTLKQQCTEETSQKVLMYISKESSLSPQILGRSLELKEAEISEILHATNPPSLFEERYQVLLKWIRNCGSDATNGQLVQALYNNDDLPTTEHVCTMLHDWSCKFCVSPDI